MRTKTGPSVLPFTPPETTLQSPAKPAGLGEETPSKEYPGDLGFYEPSIRFRHSGWRRDRERVYDALRATNQTLNRLVDFGQCGKFVYVLQSLTDPTKYMIGGSTCHDRFCLPCGNERSRRIAGNVIDELEKGQARFLTLTLRSTTEPLAELLHKLTASFTKLRRTKLWQAKVDGGVAFLEVKYNEATSRWHPHFHCLVQGRYLPNKQLAKLWKRITGDSSIIDIRIVKDNAHVTHYVAKYASKPMDHSVLLDSDRLKEAIIALKGTRLCMTFGSWQGVSLTRNRDDDKWINLGQLTELIKDATRGDPAACAALEALNMPTTSDEYIEPARGSPLSDCAICGHQTMLIDAHRSFYDLCE